MTTLPDSLAIWCRRALTISSLTEIDVWDAFEHRDGIAGAAEISEHLAAVLQSADDLWDAARDTVLPLLQLGTYVTTRPAGHWAHLYIEGNV